MTETHLQNRSPALTPQQQKEAIRRRAQGATLDELARSYNVGISTIRRATHEQHCARRNCLETNWT
jgi:DNA invertase Pin-like site-specific DNA recombinase